jgi:magnesium chelatase family protein
MRQAQPNAKLGVGDLDTYCVLEEGAKTLLKQAMLRWNWSARVVHRVLRVARTLADLSSLEVIGAMHIAEAIQYRQPWGSRPHD